MDGRWDGAAGTSAGPGAGSGVGSGMVQGEVTYAVGKKKSKSKSKKSKGSRKQKPLTALEVKAKEERLKMIAEMSKMAAAAATAMRASDLREEGKAKTVVKKVEQQKRKRGSFQPAYETFGPMKNIDSSRLKYRPPSMRVTSRENIASDKSSVANLHCDDTLRRVSVVLHRHILVCERRVSLAGKEARTTRSRTGSVFSEHRNSPSRATSDFESEPDDTNQSFDQQLPRALSPSLHRVESQQLPIPDRGYRGVLSEDAKVENALSLLDEEVYLKSQYKYAFLRLPRLPLWTPYLMERVQYTPEVPSVERIYSFIRHLFVEAELSSECSVVSLIYAERLMERAGIELLASNWRPVVMVSMLLASKVWQDLASWNIEFARVYPQFSVKSINLLERNVLKLLQWDLYISGAVYAKYYFALRSLNESENFRRRYNYIIRVGAPNTRQVEERSAQAGNSLYSRSM
mmetsp:Transcript_8877/g.15631  ORF Transcript_8877/g.15631 Transcript_8877/m.15631 type:complete len:460 (-) Transcript_8877:139-1518(-)